MSEGMRRVTPAEGGVTQDRFPAKRVAWLWGVRGQA